MELSENPRKYSLSIVVVLVALVFSAVYFTLPRLSDWTRVDASLSRLSFLNVRQLVIEVNGPLTVDKIREWLPPVEGRNILLLNANRLITHLQRHAWVQSVFLKKEFPDRV